MFGRFHCLIRCAIHIMVGLLFVVLSFYGELSYTLPSPDMHLGKPWLPLQH